MPALTIQPSKQKQHPKAHEADCPHSPTGAHYWIVGPASPEGSYGRCQYCPATRYYPPQSQQEHIPKILMQHFHCGTTDADFWCNGRLVL